MRKRFLLLAATVSFAMPAAVQAGGASSTQRVIEARAMLREDWEQYRAFVLALQLGVQCGAVEAPLAKAAVTRLHVAMIDEQANAGLLNDRVTDPQTVMRDWLDQAQTAAEAPGACARLTPAMRARLRNAADALIRTR